MRTPVVPVMLPLSIETAPTVSSKLAMSSVTPDTVTPPLESALLMP